MDKKGFRLNLLAQSLWGTGPVVTKLVSFNIAGSLLSGLRNGLGALVITSLMFKNQENRSSISQLTPHILIHLFFLGILAVAIPNILMVESIRASGAIIAAMLSRLEIPFGVILAGTVLKEKVSNKAKAATSLSLLSVILLSQTDMSFGTFDDANARGVGLGLIVALAFSLSTIYAKWIFNTFKIPSLLMTWVRTSMGAGISILIFVLFGGDIVQSLASISLVDWLAIGFLGLFVSAIAYMAYYKSLSLLDAHITQIMLGVALMIAVILGILIGETLSIFQWLGIVLVVISIYLIQTSKD